MNPESSASAEHKLTEEHGLVVSAVNDQANNCQQDVAFNEAEAYQLRSHIDQGNGTLQLVAPSDNTNAPIFNVSGGAPIIGDQVHHHHGPTHNVIHQHGPQQEIHNEQLHLHYHSNLHHNIGIKVSHFAAVSQSYVSLPGESSLGNRLLQENNPPDAFSNTDAFPNERTQEEETSRLLAELQEKVNKETMIACDQIVLPTDIDRPIIPTRLQMVSEPQRAKNDWDDEGHYRKREDLEKVYLQPPGNITANEMFYCAQQMAQLDAQRVCKNEVAKVAFVNKNGNIVGVVGQPGIGKTTSIKTWCKQILHGEILPNATIVVLIFVRYINFSKQTNLLEFLLPAELRSWCHVHRNEVKNILEKLNESHRIVLAFDGLDEAAVETLSTRVPKVSLYDSADPLTFLLNLTSGNLLPLARKIFTSRPDQLYNLLGDNRPRFIVQILGLNKEGQNELGVQICRDKYQQLEQVLLKNPDAYAYCYVPVNFILTLDYLMQHGDRVAFVCLTRVLASACEKYSCSDHLEHLNVPKGKKCELHKLSKLAWKGFLRKKIIFEEDDLRNVDLGQNTVQSFLTTSIVESANIKMTIMEGHKRSYFSHLIWQEFFAAVYMMLRMSHPEAETHFEELLDPHWDVVSKFAYGLCSHSVFYQLKQIIPGCSTNEWKAKKAALKQVAANCVEENVLISKLLKVCSWIQEAKDDDFARCVAEKLPKMIHISMYTTILPSDVWNLFYVLRHADTSPSLRVERCSFTGDSLERFSHAVAEANVKVGILNLGDSKIGDIGASLISCCLEQVEILNVFNCGITSAGVEVIAGGLSKEKAKFQELYLSRNSIGDVGAAAISRYVGRIEKLYLLDCDITSYGVRAIAENLKQRPGKMELLDLAYNRFGNEGARSLLPCLEKVKTIWLSDCGVTDSVKKEIETELQRLNLPILRQY